MLNASRHNPGLHWYALFLTAATFPLIFIGGLVTSHGAGMAVPDWPNSYGYNMFLFPPSKWVGNIWYEHVHRLYASFIGLLSIGLCLRAWFGDHRPRVRWLATAILAGVIVQGVLGGLRVVLIKLGLAIIHGCVAQAFFCLCALLAVVTSRWWADAPDLSQSRERPAGTGIVRLAVVAVLVVYCQLIVGAVMRHEQAGLAIPDLPLAYGKLLPPLDQNALLAAQLRSAGGDPLRLSSPPFSLTQVWLAFGHRIGAIVVSLTLVVLVYKVLRLNRGRPSLLGPAIVLAALLVTQLTLGVLTVVLRKPADVASTHVAVGALVLMMTFALAARAMRLYRPRAASDTIAPRRGSQIGRDGFVPDHLLRTLQNVKLMKPATEIPPLSDVLLMGATAGSAAASLPAVSLAIDFDAGNCPNDLPVQAGAIPARVRFLDLYELTKPRMNFLVVATTLVGYFMAIPVVSSLNGADRWHWMLLLHTLIGTALTAAAASVLNQHAERDYDRLMARTRNRPLPAGRISPAEALFFGIGLGACGIIDLALFVNSLTAILAGFTLASYVWLYTPLKRLTTLCTVVGAIPGALPPVMGVTAALGAVTPTAVVLFIILFMWQMPHFLAIAILYRDDYAKGGFQMLPVVDRNLMSTGLQIVLWSLALVPVSLTPVLFGVAGPTYFVAAFLMSLAFLGFAVLCALRKTRSDARHLFLASIVYLPCLLAAMMMDKV